MTPRLLSLIFFKYIQKFYLPATIFILAILGLIFVQIKFDFLSLNTNTLSQGYVGTYQAHDLPEEVLKLASYGLTGFDKNGRVIPRLATWEINNDATTFKFRIKDGVKWVDGTKVLVSDLEFPIPDVEVKYVDEKTIEFKLKEPYSPFPSLLVSPVFKKGTLIGIGPYEIVKVEKSRIFITKLTMKPIIPNLPDLIIRFYPNEKTSLNGFSLGEVQSLIRVGDPEEVVKGSLLGLNSQTDFSKIVTIFYNTKDPVLGNKPFRQALSYGAPLIENQVTASGPFPPFSWSFQENLKSYLGKSDLAKQAIGRAKDNDENVLTKEVVLTTTPQLEGVGEKVVSSWKSLGINAKLRVESGTPQNFQVLLITQSIPLDPDQYFLWHSTQTKTNLAKYSPACCPTSARVDKDLEDGRKTIKEDERKVSYSDFQRVLLEDSPATFLYFPKINIVYLKKAEKKLNQVLKFQLPSF